MFNEEYFEEYLDKINDEQKNKLDKYADLIKEYNKVMNLTGIDEKSQVYLKHYYDAFKVNEQINKLDNVNRVGDLGSGMGVPGIVLAILSPSINFDLIEPIKKRCNFLEIVVEKLQLENVNIVNKRSEEINNKYDLVVSRAVAKTNILLELTCSLIEINGYLIAMKSKQFNEELKDSKNALKILNFDYVEVDSYKLPIENSERNNAVFIKKSSSPSKYPRNFGLIKKKPL